MNNYKFSYDAKKWEEIENSVHKVYSTHPDPRSAEAAYSISNAISDAFPVISRQEAMRNSQQIIENFTGYKLDTQGMWNEFINTAKAQASDLHTSMKFSNAMIAASTQGLDSDAYKLKIQEAMEELNSEELVYRNDFKDMSILTDLLVESGRIVPSMIPTMGIYAAGGALAGVTGGASLIAAKGAGAVFSGMMEAGSVAKELFKIKDSEGNSLNQEYILSAWSLAMAGVGALNLVTDGFEKVTANVAKKIFGKQSIKQLVKSGTVANWGKKISKDYLGKGIAGEAAEEAIEELIGMVASNYVINNSNETEGTLFEGYDKEEIIKTMAQTALSTAKGMVLTGLPSAVISTVQEYNASDTKLKMDANRFTGKNDKSYAVPIIEIKIPGVSFDKDLKKVDSPVKVIQIGNTFKPVDADNATIAASLKYRGAKALNIEVVESSSPFVKESIASARSLSRNKGYEQKNGIILFDDQKTMQEAASEYALSSDTIYGYHEQEGQIILDRKQDDIEHSLVFRTKDFNEIAQKNDPAIDDAGYDPVQEVDPDLEALEAYAETQQELDEKDVLLDEQEQEFKQPEETRRPEEVVKKTYNNLQKQLTKKGATPEEHRFVNDKLLPQIHDALKEKFPDLSEEQIYETAIPSAYFGFVTAKVAGMTTDEFFGKYYTPQAFVALTVKQESDFLNSSAGKKTIQIQTGSNDTGASLSGLTIPKRGKNTIGIASGYTPLTVVHEMGHVMVKVIKDTEQFKPFLEIYKDELGKDGGKIGTNFQEAFAHDLEQYFIDGKVRDASLKAIFKKIGDGIRELLQLLNPMLDNKTRKAFDKLFDFGLEKTAKADASIKSNVQQEFDFFGDPKQVVEALARVYSPDDANRLRSIGIEEFARRRNLNTHRSEFGAMRPDSVTPGVDPLIEKLAIGMNFIMKHKDQLPADFLDGYANTIKTYEFFKTNATASEDIINEFKEFVKGNLMYLYNKVDDTVKNVTKDWYVGANKLALTWAMEYGYDLENIVGAIANLSPQKDWYQNISLAQRLIDIVKNADKLQWDETMKNAISENSDNFATFKLIKNPETGEYILDKNGNLKNYDNHMLVQYIKGKTLGDLIREKDEDSTSDADLEYVTLPASSIKTLKTEAKQREEKIRRLRKIRKHRIAAWIRLYDETHNSKAYRIVNIDGSFGDFMKKEDGINVDVAWGSFNEIACSFDALTAKDAKTISDSLGDFHKVRNFYNNILVPESENGYVTIDTHAVAAALLIPVSGTGKEVLQNFSSAGAGKVNPSGINPKGSGVYGIHGMYPIYADAYNEVAQELGILPRELQSITWEAVRKLFTEEYKKGKTVVDVAKGKWADYYNKGGDIDATRDAIVKDANEKVGAGATVAEQINGGYGLQHDAVQWRDSYERTLYHDELGNRPGYGGSVARDRDVSALGLPRPGEQDSLGGNGGTDNQGSSGVRSDLDDDFLASISPAGDITSQKFKNWFKKGEYVNPDGSPRLAYHGTKNTFKAFKGGYNNGMIFFSTNPDFSSTWGLGLQPTKEADERRSEAARYENNLDVKLLEEALDNGVDFSDIDSYVAPKRREAMLKRYGLETSVDVEMAHGATVIPVYLNPQKIFHPERDYALSIKIYSELSPTTLNSEESKKAILNGEWEYFEHPAFIERIMALGYDGIWLREKADGPMETISVFNPNNIKSVFNGGEWSTENDEILAKVSDVISKERVKEMLANNEYPSDAELQIHAGDPDVDWEIQFRRIFTQDPDVIKEFKKAVDEVSDSLEKNEEIDPEKVLEVLSGNKDSESMFGEVRDPRRFVERLLWQSKFIGPTEADNKFKRDLSSGAFLKKVVLALVENRDPADFGHYLPGPFSLYMEGIRDESKMTVYKNRKAREEILSDVRKYRKMYYKRLGYTQQLSYEETVEGTALDNGNSVESFGNEEIRNLLESKDTDPILKDLIRKNLATGDVLQTLIDDANSQIEQLEMEVMEAEAEAENNAVELGVKNDMLDIAIEQIGDLKTESATKDSIINTGVQELSQTKDKLKNATNKLNQTDGRYRKLQKANAKNYENKRKEERKRIVREKMIQYMRAKEQLEKHLGAINKISNAKNPNNDARIMHALKVSIDALKEPWQDLTSYFEKNGVDINDIPDQMKQFFIINNLGVYAQKLYDDLDFITAAAIHRAALDVREDARIEKAIRDADQKRELYKMSREYAMTYRGASWDDVKTEDRYKDFMAREKLSGNVQNAKNKYQAYFETHFITMSRIINKIDPNGDVIKPFLFGGYDKNGVFHRGIEGVLDDEKREEYKRYQSMRQAMDKYEITEKALLEKRVEVTSGSLTLEEAMGVYIYAQQSDALQKLTSPNGNKLVIQRDDQGNVIINEIELVVNSLTDEERAFADWMKDEMGSRWQEISDVYYKVNNKTLGKVANYFPLIRSGEQVVFEDLMQDQFLRMQETPDDSITRARLGGDYELQLNAFSIWNKMVAKQEHYIAGAEFFNKANRLMHKNGGDLYNLIAMNNGKEYANALQDFINRVANKRYIYDDADSLVNKVRSNLVVARLGFNLLTTLKQLPAFGLFAQQFGVGRLFEAIAHMSSDYKGTSEFIYDKSPQMRGHSMSIDFSSFTQMETKTEFGRKVKKIGEVGMTPIQFIDGFIKKTLWYGAYQNNIANGMTDEQASMEATKWINDTQPGGTTKDSAAIYDTNSTIVKYLLMFTNQLNKNMNIVYDIPYAIKNKMYEKAFKNMVGLGISLAGIVALEGGFDDEDDDDKMWDNLLKNFSSQFISMFPVIGPDVSDIVMDRYYSDSGMPLVSEVYSFTKAVGSGEKDRIVDRGVSLGLGGAEFVGLPSGQVKKIWDAFTEDGKVNLWYLLGRDFVE